MYGTDIGPECPCCKGTIWSYLPIGSMIKFAVDAKCISCHHMESFTAPPNQGNPHISELREAHHKSRKP